MKYAVHTNTKNELEEIKDAILHTIMGSQSDAIENGYLDKKYKNMTTEQLFDRYYTARKTLEKYKRNSK